MFGYSVIKTRDLEALISAANGVEPGPDDINSLFRTLGRGRLSGPLFTAALAIVATQPRMLAAFKELFDSHRQVFNNEVVVDADAYLSAWEAHVAQLNTIRDALSRAGFELKVVSHGD